MLPHEQEFRPRLLPNHCAREVCGDESQHEAHIYFVFDLDLRAPHLCVSMGQTDRVVEHTAPSWRTSCPPARGGTAGAGCRGTTSSSGRGRAHRADSDVALLEEGARETHRAQDRRELGAASPTGDLRTTGPVGGGAPALLHGPQRPVHRPPQGSSYESMAVSWSHGRHRHRLRYPRSECWQGSDPGADRRAGDGRSLCPPGRVQALISYTVTHFFSSQSVAKVAKPQWARRR